ncbi:MAG: hypothetical protein L6M37_02875 [Candidatus Methylarchaceae archaeon HK02M1]|nr:hypothetical protein [Candidatus Methylarchaceae archaeon HK02M1]
MSKNDRLKAVKTLTLAKLVGSCVGKRPTLKLMILKDCWSMINWNLGTET